YLDITGAIKGYADGKPTGALTAHDSWRLGIDVSAIGPLVTSYGMLAYTVDETRIAADVSAYREAVGDRELRVILRPGLPDPGDAEHLAAKVRSAREAGADAVDFYNYGMNPLPVLDRIPGAL